MRVAVVGDIHMCASKNAPQYAFLLRAVERIQCDGVTTVINVGDITAFGEYDAFCEYLELLRAFDHHYILGNSDVRDKTTEQRMLSHASRSSFFIEGREIMGIHTPYGVVEPRDREALESLADGSIVFFHHYIGSFKRESRDFLETLLARKQLTVIHGHSHKATDERVGKSRVIGVRALDPDKAIGAYPTITYMDITPHDISLCEIYLDVSREVLADVRSHMGLSCFDNPSDIAFAAANRVDAIELRFNGNKPLPGEELVPLLAHWRSLTSGYLSIHMPALKWEDGALHGAERWHNALQLAVKLGANALTIHPPIAHIRDMEQGSEACETLLGMYVEAVRFVGGGVRIGIENLHMKKGETVEDRNFGYTPAEIAEWIDSINRCLEVPHRVGHVLDVGHARNNGIYASIYPVSRWYELMGRRTVAYHIHQAISTAEGMKNHQPLVDWFGPMISYVSFFFSWGRNVVNNVPIFLEVKGSESFAASIEAFDRTFEFETNNRER